MAAGRPAVEGFLRRLASALVAGAVGGLVAGVLGRLGMRLLTITSTGAARGMVTDDAAVVGEVSVSGTVGLVGFVTVVGTVLGPLYLVARRGLPASGRGRVLGSAGLGAAAGAIVLVHEADTFDYGVLGPRWLSVTLFLAIPAVLAATVAALVERWDRPESWFHTGPTRLTLLPLAVLLVPFVGIPVGIGAAVAAVPAVRSAWATRPVTYLAVAVAIGIGLIGAIDLTTDVVSMARAG